MSSQPREEVLKQYEEKWTQEQFQLKQKLIIEDDFDFELPNTNTNTNTNVTYTEEQDLKITDLLNNNHKKKSPLRYIGGVDISHGEKDEDIACAGLTVLEYPSMKEVYRRFNIVRFTQPYIPGFLAFREVEFLAAIIKELKEECSEYLPQIILVDGNGVLHQRGFGLACHLGVLINIPTIGIAKNLLVIDGLNQKGFKKEFTAFLGKNKSKNLNNINSNNNNNINNNGIMDIIGPISKQKWGVAMLCSMFGREHLSKRQQKSADDAKNPIYVSVGHRVSLESAIEIVKLTSRGVRLPEPIRAADHGTREAILKYEKELAKKNSTQ